jgi:hypothetical protein
MSVISDTSPLCYLILIEQINLLSQLYGQIIIPDVVQQELQTASAPISVQQWINRPPPWLTIQALNQPPDLALNRLDPGEQVRSRLPNSSMPACFSSTNGMVEKSPCNEDYQLLARAAR